MGIEIAPTLLETDQHVVVISPHLDDGVLSCGALISTCRNATVVTLFTGMPTALDISTAWDQECGFDSAEQAVIARRDEDRLAMTALGARVRHLDCLDGQYLGTIDVGTDEAQLASALSVALTELAPDVLVVPMGLFHSDHIRARRAWIRCSRSGVAATSRWVAYEDVPYRNIDASLQSALHALYEAGFSATPAQWHTIPKTGALPLPEKIPSHSRGNGLPRPRVQDIAAFQCKHTALHAYQSQLAALGAAALADAFEPERFWAIGTR
ncbi:PIG-L deacetylase family protein [Robbsia andropogonis]|uniref:PIG-L deacetylase family protein n=1 Tax=Robbsia andropogonis TaxID=28092 RepID=UPI003D1EE8E9